MFKAHKIGVLPIEDE